MGSVQKEIGDIISSGNYYVTPDLYKELRTVERGVNDLNLDANLLRTTRELGSTNRYASGGLTQSLNEAGNALGRVKENLDWKKIDSMQANQIRKTHHDAVVDLQKMRQGYLGSEVSGARKRLDQFADTIGVTDRFTGYRNNLSRGSRDPLKLDTYWMREHNNQRVKFGEQGIDRRFLNPQRHGYDQYTSYISRKPSREAIGGSYSARVERPRVSFADTRPQTTTAIERPPQRSIQEQCGINMVYPGESEYMKRYKAPKKFRLGDHQINPTPDFTKYGRPLAAKVYTPASSEYQFRYTYPDGNLIKKLPWLRQ